ncbi:MAG: ECF-type sigma factor [Planctomycetota bacterium]
MSTPPDITRVLQRIPSDPAALETVIASVYGELRAIASSRLRSERADHTLDATSLVHEACLRLLGTTSQTFEGRGHFFGAVATAMQRVLIDHARARGREKRGGGRVRLPLDVVDLAVEADLGEVRALEEALEILAEEDPQAHSVVRLRFFAGLSVAETAAVLEISERTAARDWAFVRARLSELVDEAAP